MEDPMNQNDESKSINLNESIINSQIQKSIDLLNEILDTQDEIFDQGLLDLPESLDEKVNSIDFEPIKIIGQKIINSRKKLNDFIKAKINLNNSNPNDDNKLLNNATKNDQLNYFNTSIISIDSIRNSTEMQEESSNKTGDDQEKEEDNDKKSNHDRDNDEKEDESKDNNENNSSIEKLESSNKNAINDEYSGNSSNNEEINENEIKNDQISSDNAQYYENYEIIPRQRSSSAHEKCKIPNGRPIPPLSPNFNNHSDNDIDTNAKVKQQASSPTQILRIPPLSKMKAPSLFRSRERALSTLTSSNLPLLTSSVSLPTTPRMKRASNQFVNDEEKVKKISDSCFNPLPNFASICSTIEKIDKTLSDYNKTKFDQFANAETRLKNISRSIHSFIRMNNKIEQNLKQIISDSQIDSEKDETSNKDENEFLHIKKNIQSLLLIKEGQNKKIKQQAKEINNLKTQIESLRIFIKNNQKQIAKFKQQFYDNLTTDVVNDENNENKVEVGLHFKQRSKSIDFFNSFLFDDESDFELSNYCNQLRMTNDDANLHEMVKQIDQLLCTIDNEEYEENVDVEFRLEKLRERVSKLYMIDEDQITKNWTLICAEGAEIDNPEIRSFFFEKQYSETQAKLLSLEKQRTKLFELFFSFSNNKSKRDSNNDNNDNEDDDEDDEMDDYITNTISESILDDLNEKNLTIDKLSKIIVDLKKEIETKNKNSENLTKKLNKQAKENKELIRKYEEISNKFSESEAKLNQRMKEIRSLNRKKDSDERKIERLERRIDEINELNKKNGSITEIKNISNSLIGELSSMKLLADQQEKAISELHQIKEQLEDELEASNEALKDSMVDIQEKTESLKNLEGQLQEEKENLKLKDVEINEVKSLLEHQVNENEKLNETIKVLTNSSVQDENDNDKIEDNGDLSIIGSLKKQVAALTEENEKKELQIKDLNKQILSSEPRLYSLRRKSVSQRNIINELTGKNEKMKNSIESKYQEKIDKLNERIAELESQLQNTGNTLNIEANNNQKEEAINNEQKETTRSIQKESFNNKQKEISNNQFEGPFNNEHKETTRSVQKEPFNDEQKDISNNQGEESFNNEQKVTTRSVQKEPFNDEQKEINNKQFEGPFNNEQKETTRSVQKEAINNEQKEISNSHGEESFNNEQKETTRSVQKEAINNEQKEISNSHGEESFNNEQKETTRSVQKEPINNEQKEKSGVVSDYEKIESEMKRELLRLAKENDELKRINEEMKSHIENKEAIKTKAIEIDNEKEISTDAINGSSESNGKIGSSSNRGSTGSVITSDAVVCSNENNDECRSSRQNEALLNEEDSIHLSSAEKQKENEMRNEMARLSKENEEMKNQIQSFQQNSIVGKEIQEMRESLEQEYQDKLNKMNLHIIDLEEQLQSSRNTKESSNSIENVNNKYEEKAEAEEAALNELDKLRLENEELKRKNDAMKSQLAQFNNKQITENKSSSDEVSNAEQAGENMSITENTINSNEMSVFGNTHESSRVELQSNETSQVVEKEEEKLHCAKDKEESIHLSITEKQKENEIARLSKENEEMHKLIEEMKNQIQNYQQNPIFEKEKQEKRETHEQEYQDKLNTKENSKSNENVKESENKYEIKEEEALNELDRLRLENEELKRKNEEMKSRLTLFNNEGNNETEEKNQNPTKDKETFVIEEEEEENEREETSKDELIVDCKVVYESSSEQISSTITTNNKEETPQATGKDEESKHEYNTEILSSNASSKSIETPNKVHQNDQETTNEFNHQHQKEGSESSVSDGNNQKVSSLEKRIAELEEKNSREVLYETFLSSILGENVTMISEEQLISRIESFQISESISSHLEEGKTKNKKENDVGIENILSLSQTKLVVSSGDFTSSEENSSKDLIFTGDEYIHLSITEKQKESEIARLSKENEEMHKLIEEMKKQIQNYQQNPIFEKGNEEKMETHEQEYQDKLNKMKLQINDLEEKLQNSRISKENSKENENKYEVKEEEALNELYQLRLENEELKRKNEEMKSQRTLFNNEGNKNPTKDKEIFVIEEEEENENLIMNNMHKSEEDKQNTNNEISETEQQQEKFEIEEEEEREGENYDSTSPNYDSEKQEFHSKPFLSVRDYQLRIWELEKENEKLIKEKHQFNNSEEKLLNTEKVDKVNSSSKLIENNNDDISKNNDQELNNELNDQHHKGISESSIIEEEEEEENEKPTMNNIYKPREKKQNTNNEISETEQQQEKFEIEEEEEREGENYDSTSPNYDSEKQDFHSKPFFSVRDYQLYVWELEKENEKLKKENHLNSREALYETFLSSILGENVTMISEEQLISRIESFQISESISSHLEEGKIKNKKENDVGIENILSLSQTKLVVSSGDFTSSEESANINDGQQQATTNMSRNMENKINNNDDDNNNVVRNRSINITENTKNSNNEMNGIRSTRDSSGVHLQSDETSLVVQKEEELLQCQKEIFDLTSANDRLKLENEHLLSQLSVCEGELHAMQTQMSTVFKLFGKQAYSLNHNEALNSEEFSQIIEKLKSEKEESTHLSITEKQKENEMRNEVARLSKENEEMHKLVSEMERQSSVAESEIQEMRRSIESEYQDKLDKMNLKVIDLEQQVQNSGSSKENTKENENRYEAALNELDQLRLENEELKRKNDEMKSQLTLFNNKQITENKQNNGIENTSSSNEMNGFRSTRDSSGVELQSNETSHVVEKEETIHLSITEKQKENEIARLLKENEEMHKLVEEMKSQIQNYQQNPIFEKGKQEKSETHEQEYQDKLNTKEDPSSIGNAHESENKCELKEEAALNELDQLRLENEELKRKNEEMKSQLTQFNNEGNKNPTNDKEIFVIEEEEENEEDKQNTNNEISETEPQQETFEIEEEEEREGENDDSASPNYDSEKQDFHSKPFLSVRDYQLYVWQLEKENEKLMKEKHQFNNSEGKLLNTEKVDKVKSLLLSPIFEFTITSSEIYDDKYTICIPSLSTEYGYDSNRFSHDMSEQFGPVLSASLSTVFMPNDQYLTFGFVNFTSRKSDMKLFERNNSDNENINTNDCYYVKSQVIVTNLPFGIKKSEVISELSKFTSSLSINLNGNNVKNVFYEDSINPEYLIDFKNNVDDAQTFVEAIQNRNINDVFSYHMSGYIPIAFYYDPCPFKMNENRQKAIGKFSSNARLIAMMEPQQFQVFDFNSYFSGLINKSENDAIYRPQIVSNENHDNGNQFRLIVDRRFVVSENFPKFRKFEVVFTNDLEAVMAQTFALNYNCDILQIFHSNFQGNRIAGNDF